MLDRPDSESGKSQLQIELEKQKQIRGYKSRILRDAPHVPLGLEYLWDWYQTLAARRTAGFSLNPITWSDMQACFTLLRIRPEVWEVDTICQIDTAFIMSRVSKTTSVVSGAVALKDKVPAK